MFIMAFLSWWYGDGWLKIAANLDGHIKGVLNAFSVNQLLHTLFAPWRRIVSYPGASLSDKFHAWSDNLFSRTIGFVIRLMVILAALLTVIAVTFLNLIEFMAWPLLPVGIIGFVIAGIIW